MLKTSSVVPSPDRQKQELRQGAHGSLRLCDQGMAEWSNNGDPDDYPPRWLSRDSSRDRRRPGTASCELLAAADGRNGQADPEKAADGFDELGHRDRLRQIGLATAFADALLVALHRKGGHCDHRNGLELRVFLEPLGHFETGDFRQLNVHQDQIRTVLAGEIERLDAVARADGIVAV